MRPRQGCAVGVGYKLLSRLRGYHLKAETYIGRLPQNGLLFVTVILVSKKTAIIVPMGGERLALAVVVLFQPHQQP